MMLLRHFLPSLVRICFICCRIFSICNVIYSRIFSSSDDLHMPCGVSITLKYREHMRPHCRVLRLAAWWDAALLTGCRHWLILIFTLFFFSFLSIESRFPAETPALYSCYVYVFLTGDLFAATFCAAVRAPVVHIASLRGAMTGKFC